jgi:pimeloyl-ACP methyl ester carboxylesterase
LRAQTATPVSKPKPRNAQRKFQSTSDVSLWTEALFGAEVLLLHASPVYYGFGVPDGDGSGVVIIPGFLGTDLYLNELRGWLTRIGYRAYFSGIGINADCPNLLIQRRLNETLEKALDETGRRIHLIGHSLGGVIARSVAGARPKDIASLITLASPIQGTVAHRNIIHAAEAVRLRILQEHGDGVLPHCYTGRCTCNFVDSLRRKVPDSIRQTAIYTRHDGVVDWRFCMTGKKEQDFAVPGTHIGMAFNSAAYSIIGKRLAQTNGSH